MSGLVFIDTTHLKVTYRDGRTRLSELVAMKNLQIKDLTVTIQVASEISDNFIMDEKYIDPIFIPKLPKNDYDL